MRYFKLNYYTSEGAYETWEDLIDEPKFRQIQKAILDGNDFIIMENKVIKRSAIREMSPADDIVQYYVSTGSTLEGMKLRGSPERIGLSDEATEKVEGLYERLKLEK
jgi:hypothetical protein